MSLADAIHELRERVNELHGWLSALTDGVSRAGGGTAHHLVDQVEKATLEMVGWLNQAQSAIWRASRAGASADEILLALTEAQLALDQLHRKEPSGLRSRVLMEHLIDLYRRHAKTGSDAERRLGVWAGETIPLVRAACAGVPLVRGALAACWRELASQPVERAKTGT